ncbi:MAG TPA: hypothetical protein VK250_12360 [Nitrososphaeraceae archaeon]|nr:hypothetical protein [Nitrososphaeraceae archaeon]
MITLLALFQPIIIVIFLIFHVEFYSKARTDRLSPTQDEKFIDNGSFIDTGGRLLPND